MREPAKAHLLLLLLRTKQKKKWQLEEQFLSIKGYWEFNYLSCEVFQGCGQLIRVIMHGVRGHVHRAWGGGCCCSLERTKERREEEKKVCLSLFPDMRTPTLPAADEEVFGHGRCSCLCCCWGGQKLWGELLTRREGENDFIWLLLIFSHLKLHKVTLKVMPAGHFCADIICTVWRGYGVAPLAYIYNSLFKCLSIQKNFTKLTKTREPFISLWLNRKATGNVDIRLWTAVKRYKLPMGPACVCVSMFAATAR